MTVTSCGNQYHVVIIIIGITSYDSMCSVVQSMCTVYPYPYPYTFKPLNVIYMSLSKQYAINRKIKSMWFEFEPHSLHLCHTNSYNTLSFFLIHVHTLTELPSYKLNVNVYNFLFIRIIWFSWWLISSICIIV